MEQLIVATREDLKILIEESVRTALKETSPINEQKTGAIQYLSIKEAASYLNLAVQTLYGFTSTRTIPFIKRGKRVLFVKSELDSWMVQGKKITRNQIAEDLA